MSVYTCSRCGALRNTDDCPPSFDPALPTSAELLCEPCWVEVDAQDLDEALTALFGASARRMRVC